MFIFENCLLNFSPFNRIQHVVNGSHMCEYVHAHMSTYYVYIKDLLMM